MTHTEPYKTILVGGAFQSSHQSSASEHITNANITLVERFKSHWSGIEEQACHLVASIQKIEMPVRVIGHSLGALVAYRAHQLASEGIIPRTVLMNCGSIGEPMPFQTGVVCNPMNMLFGWMSMLRNQESILALQEASLGHVQIGDRTDGLIMLAGANDQVIPRGFSERTAKRIRARLIMLHGGHNLLDDDEGGDLLEVVMKWFDTGTGLRQLPNLIPQRNLVTS